MRLPPSVGILLVHVLPGPLIVAIQGKNDFPDDERNRRGDDQGDENVLHGYISTFPARQALTACSIACM